MNILHTNWKINFFIWMSALISFFFQQSNIHLIILSNMLSSSFWIILGKVSANTDVNAILLDFLTNLLHSFISRRTELFIISNINDWYFVEQQDMKRSKFFQNLIKTHFYLEYAKQMFIVVAVFLFHKIFALIHDPHALKIIIFMCSIFFHFLLLL